MKKLKEFQNSGVEFVFTDIDDTLTDHGQLKAEAYQALWRLKDAGFKIIPITGRPAGWCEMIARFWPVEGVVGENGGFYFRYVNRQMKREFFFSPSTQAANRKKLEDLAKVILKTVPKAQIASDQFCRLMDLAVDFAEDVHPPLSENEITRIVSCFENAGAKAKVSSIHVNGWFGDYDKLTMCKILMQKEFGLELDQIQSRCLFAGDSPNDEPMFAYFQNSFAVANIVKFASRLKNLPKFVTTREGGHGFVEIADHLLRKP